MKREQINTLAISVTVLIALLFFLLLDASFYFYFLLTAGSQALLGVSVYVVLSDREAVEHGGMEGVLDK